MTATLKLAVIAGDGIGPEVIKQAGRVLDAVLPGDRVITRGTQAWAQRRRPD